MPETDPKTFKGQAAEHDASAASTFDDDDWFFLTFFGQLTECLHLPEHDAERPHVSLEAVMVVFEVLRRVPAQRHSPLMQTDGKAT